MITTNLSEKDASILKSMLMTFSNSRSSEQARVVKETVAQINNQQFDVSDFESSRQYEYLSIQNAGHLTNWDKATNK